MTNQQLIAELQERDLEAPIEVAGGEIVDINYTDDGKLKLIGENDE